MAYLLLSYIILFFYSLAIVLIFFYSLAQFNLLLNYLKSKKNCISREKFDFNNPSEIPFVTIQLPIFNEKYVVERLLLTVSQLDYPKDKLEIQVLDDSIDDSVLETQNIIAKIAQTGIQIQHIRRTDRVGFKAGALKEGLKIAKGDFVVIFDADFVPKKDWLLQTIPYFKDEKVGKWKNQKRKKHEHFCFSRNEK